MKKIRRFHLIFLTTATVFIWNVPWIECGGDVLTKDDLKEYLSIYEQSKLTTTPSPSSTIKLKRRKSSSPSPSPDQLIQQLSLLNTLINDHSNEGKKQIAQRKHSTKSISHQDKPQQLNLKSSPQLREVSDKETAEFLSQILLSNAQSKQQQNNQDFGSFTNSPIKLETDSSNQISQVINLLSTLGTLSSLAGGGGGISNNGGGGNVLIGAMLRNGGNYNGLNNLFQNQQQQPPGVLNSIVGLGSSVQSVLGQSLKGLSGTREDGKPRVRGFDTRLGLGYRLGQNLDAQVMWEVGPQLFTEPLPNEKKETSQNQQQLQNQLIQFIKLQQEQNNRKETIKENTANERLGKLYNQQQQYSPSKYSTKIIQPNTKLRKYNTQTKTKIPSGILLPPTEIYHHQSYNNVPLLAYTPGPAPKINYKTPHNILTPAKILSTQLNNPRDHFNKNKEDPYVMFTNYEKWLIQQKHNTIQKRELKINNQEDASLLKRMGRIEPPQHQIPPSTPILPPPPYHNFQHHPMIHHPIQHMPMHMPMHPIYYSRRPPPPPLPLHYSLNNQQTNKNAFQNFVAESDDSFLRRNAIVTKKPKSPESEKPLHRTSSLISELKPNGGMIGMIKTVIDNPVTRYLFQTTTLGPLGYDFYTTTKPPIIATTPSTPIPKFHDHFGRPKEQQTAESSHGISSEDEDPDAFVHIGKPLPYSQLTQVMDTKPRDKIRYYKDKDGISSLMNAHEIIKGNSDDEVVHIPGMEMFIDVDSGEVSVRKPIGSLSSFGEDITPKPKTQEEEEDEESQKLYERLQEHFKSNFEEHKIKQEILKALEEKRNKIKNSEDETLGLVNKYFDLIQQQP